MTTSIEYAFDRYQLAAIGTELTGHPAHSLYEDFTWDTSKTMSGASDHWAYGHLGVFSWTTEFWDIVSAATDVVTISLEPIR